METEPLVTVVLPVYNSAEFLSACLQSILNQRFTQWELIAVDDGSTDDSRSILLSVKDPRIRVESNCTNKGPGFTRNRILRLARAPIVVLQDADDTMHPDRLLLQYSMLQNSRNADLVTCAVERIGESGTPVGVRKARASTLTVDDLLFFRRGPVHATLMGRKSWFERNPYPEDLMRAEDTVMILQAVSKSDFNFEVLDHPLYRYRETSGLRKRKLLAAYKIERRVLARYIDKGWKKFIYLSLSLAKTAIASTFNVRALVAKWKIENLF